MSELEATQLLRVLIQQNSAQVQSWLRDVWTEPQQVPEKFNWLGLAEVSTSKAQELSYKSNESHSESLGWAEVATSVYKFLAENQPNVSEGYLLSSMSLRAYMILKFGVVSNHPVLDLKQIVTWFFDGLGITPQEALSKTTAWRNILAKNNPEEGQEYFENNLEDIRQLRRIKTRLTVIKRLSESKQFSPNEELKLWISLFDKLP